MLETRQPTRDDAARTAAQPLPAAAPRPGARPSPSRTALAAPAPARRSPRPLPDRMARSEARLLTTAVACTVAFCALLVLYLAAYAHITLLGIDQAGMRTALRQKRLENETLRATLAGLRSPDHVAAFALAKGMTRDLRQIDYIAPPRHVVIAAPAAPLLSTTTQTADTSQTANTRQGTDSGPTDNLLPSRDH